LIAYLAGRPVVGDRIVHVRHDRLDDELVYRLDRDGHVVWTWIADRCDETERFSDRSSTGASTASSPHAQISWPRYCRARASPPPATMAESCGDRSIPGPDAVVHGERVHPRLPGAGDLIRHRTRPRGHLATPANRKAAERQRFRHGVGALCTGTSDRLTDSKLHRFSCCFTAQQPTYVHVGVAPAVVDGLPR
jgi:hypothetical protein